MGNLESGNAVTKVGIGQLAVALNQLEDRIGDSLAGIESSFSRVADTLDTTLQRLETKLNAVRTTLKLLPGHLKEMGNVVGRAAKKAGDLGLPGGGILGEWINLLPSEPEDEQLRRDFYSDDGGKLRNRFGTYERDIKSYGSDLDTVRAEEDIANIRHKQELLLDAIMNKAYDLKNEIDAGRLLDPISGASLQENLESVIEALKEIRDLATDSNHRKAIEDYLQGFDKGMLGPGGSGSSSRFSPPDPAPAGSEQTDARKTSLQYPQAGNFGSRTIYPGSDPAGASLQRLDKSLGKTAQGYNLLTEALEHFTTQGGSLNALVAATNSGLQVQSTVLDILRGQVPELGQSLTGLFAETTEGAEGLNRAVAAMGDRFLDAFEGAIVRGESLGDVLKSLGRDLANLALNEVKTGGLGGLFGMFGKLFGNGTILNAKGDAFSHGRSLTALARGGALTNSIVNRPTLFPMADGRGLMGEAGPEAVLPLTRLANGDLGVSMPTPAPAAASGPPMQFFIDARGADRDGMRQLAAAVREVKAEVRYVNNTLERRAVGAMAYARGRGGNIARAFGGW